MLFTSIGGSRLRKLSMNVFIERNSPRQSAPSHGALRPSPDPQQHGTPTRRKTHSAWEQAVRDSGGMFDRDLRDLSRHYPTLSMMELRVATLVKAGLPSWRIAETLCLCEQTIENHRIHIRSKLEIAITQSLFTALTK